MPIESGREYTVGEGMNKARAIRARKQETKHYKKTSFDFLTQEKVDLMMNHINSYTRKKLNDRSAHQLFSFLYGSDVAEKLHSHPIHAAEINLTPELLK